MTERIRVHAVSLGCPKNRVDTERLLGGLLPGLLPEEDPLKAEIILINTCGFIQPAVRESVQTILEIVGKTADLDPRPMITVTGCLVARYGEELEREIPEVDLWLPMDRQPLWPSLMAGRLQGKDAPHLAQRLVSTPPGYAYLKVAEGCDCSCRFCIIPRLRGPLRSRPQEGLVEEAVTLLQMGVKEIVLVAQDLTAYGRDLGLKHGLLTLLERLVALPGLSWLRMLYLYPAGMSRTLLQGLADLGPPLLPYFDVPLQHAHPEILRSMGRPFSRDPLEVVGSIRSYFPDAAVRTSLIVGYPGEGIAHFRVLKDFVTKARLTNLGVFPFWPEEGTEAAGLPEQVHERTKLKRVREIMELQAGISRDHLERYVQEEVKVLVDAPHPEWPGLFTGRTWFQAPEIDGVTYVSGPGIEPGALVDATVEEASDYDLVALT
jgi:ribosomal protein S12 methylthiotransferase